jgi:hypothetical protein
VRREFLLLEMVPTSALRRARLMISEVPWWYGRETVALCLGMATVVAGMVEIWCGGWGLAVGALVTEGGGMGGVAVAVTLDGPRWVTVQGQGLVDLLEFGCLAGRTCGEEAATSGEGEDGGALVL